MLRLEAPVITNGELAKIKQLDRPGIRSRTFSILFPRSEGRGRAWNADLKELREEASQAIAEGVAILILSDRGVNHEQVPIPALLAVSNVHHHLIREGTRTQCGLVVETGEAREVHHFALLTAYGAGAVNPYLALATLDDMQAQRYFPESLTHKQLHKNFIKAGVKGILKVMSKMGISTQQSYRGAQIFEAVGLEFAIRQRVFLLDTEPNSRRRPGGNCRRGHSPSRTCLSAHGSAGAARFRCRRPISMASQRRSPHHESRRGGEASARHANQQPGRI